MALTYYHPDMSFYNISEKEYKYIKVWESRDNGNTWDILHSGGYINSDSPSDYFSTVVSPIGGEYKRGLMADTTPFAFDADRNIHVCQIVYRHQSDSVDQGFTGIKYFINDAVVLEKTLYLMLNQADVTDVWEDGTDYRAVEGQLLVKNDGTAKFFMFPDKRVVSGGSATWTNVFHVINFNVTGSSATYVSIETYDIGATSDGSPTGYKLFYVHEKADGTYYIGALLNEKVVLIDYDGESATVIENYSLGTNNNYDITINDDYMAIISSSRDTIKIYKIAEDSWVTMSSPGAWTYSITTSIFVNLIGTKVFVYADCDHYDEIDDIGVGKIWWRDIETGTSWEHYYVPPGNSRVGYDLPEPGTFPEVMITSRSEEDGIEFVLCRVVAYWGGTDVTTAPADIMYVKVSFIGSAEIGPNTQGALKTNNKYGTS